MPWNLGLVIGGGMSFPFFQNFDGLVALPTGWTADGPVTFSATGIGGDATISMDFPLTATPGGAVAVVMHIIGTLTDSTIQWLLSGSGTISHTHDTGDGEWWIASVISGGTRTNYFAQDTGPVQVVVGLSDIPPPFLNHFEVGLDATLRQFYVDPVAINQDAVMAVWRDLMGWTNVAGFVFPNFTDWRNLDTFPSLWSLQPGTPAPVFHVDGTAGSSSGTNTIVRMPINPFTDNNLTVILHGDGDWYTALNSNLEFGNHQVSLFMDDVPVGFFGNQNLVLPSRPGEQWVALVHTPGITQLYASTQYGITRAIAQGGGVAGILNVMKLIFNLGDRVMHSYVHNVALNGNQIEDVWELMGWIPPIQLDAFVVSGGPTVYTNGYLWQGTHSSGGLPKLLRVNLTTEEYSLVGNFPAGADINGMVAFGANLWMISQSPSLVMRYNMTTGVVTTWPNGANLGISPFIAYASGYIWTNTAAPGGGSALRRTNMSDGTATVFDLGFFSGFVLAMASDGNDIFLRRSGGGGDPDYIGRYDGVTAAETLFVTDTFTGNWGDIGSDGTYLYVQNSANSNTHRIQRFRISDGALITYGPFTTTGGVNFGYRGFDGTYLWFLAAGIGTGDNYILRINRTTGVSTMFTDDDNVIGLHLVGTDIWLSVHPWYFKPFLP